jgi:uncharacterized protein involved in outer membrane biogenesis
MVIQNTLSRAMPSSLRKIFISLPFKILAGVVTAYFLFAYLAVDPLVRHVLPWVAERQLASHASVGHARFDPWRLALTLDDFHLARMDDKPLASFDHLYIDLEAKGLFQWAWRLHDIQLDGPKIHLEIGADGKFNWAELIAKLNEDNTPSTTIPRVIIEHIRIAHGSVHYDENNRTPAFNVALEPLGIELDGLSTLPEDRGDYLIAAKLPDQGGTLKWKGHVELNPVASNGELEIEGVHVTSLLEALPAGTVPVHISDGQLRTRLDYRFAMVKAGAGQVPDIHLSNILLALDHLQGELQAPAKNTLALEHAEAKLPEVAISMTKGLQLRSNQMAVNLQDASVQLEHTPVFKLHAAAISGIDFDLGERHLKITEIALDHGAIQLTRRQDGQLDIQSLIPAASASKNNPATADHTEPAPTFKIEMAKAHLDHWQAGVQDQSFKHPLSLNIQDINLALAVSNATGDWNIAQLESTLNQISLKSEASTHPAATLSKVALRGGNISLKDQTVQGQEITLSGLQSQVVLDAQGQPDWLAFLEPASPAKPGSAQQPHEKTAAASPWKLALDRIALDQGTVHLEDRSTSTPVALDIADAGIEVQHPSLNLAQSLPIKAHFNVKQGGTFEATGKLTPAPFATNLKISLQNLSFKPFSPYVNRVAMLKLNDGRASLHGAVALKASPSLKTQFRGGFSIDQLAIDEESTNLPFLGWKSVSSDTVDLSLSPNRLHLDELRVTEPVGEVVIYEDKTINIKRILRAAPPAASPAPTAPKTDNTAASDSFPVAVERVKIENGDFKFADLSLTPQFGTHMNSLSGVVNGLSTAATTVAQVELDGKVDEYGSARIRGSLQPFQATDFTDLTLAFHNLEMNHLTPYSGKFAGRKIDSGKMSVDLEYKIKQRQMSGENKFVINKLKLGERVQSPDAVNLPLDLAIAILEDSDGNIDLDLPVSGNLDDPQFSYGKIIWKAITNVIGKIVTAPFRALGHLLGISSEKMEALAFDPGSATLAPPELEKLKHLADAMSKRQSLQLTLVPTYDPEADRKALQENTLRRDVAQEAGLKLKADESPGPIDTRNPKTQDAILALFRERSPDAKNRSLATKFKDYLNIAKPTDPAAYDAMVQQLQQWIVVPDDKLKTLAADRATALEQALEKAGMEASRIGKAAPETAHAEGQVIQMKMTLGTAKEAPNK